MRKVLLLAVTVVTAVLAKDSRCIQQTDVNSSNLIHEDDCRKYYSCDANQDIWERDCPKGLEFNPLILKCDVPRGFCTPNTYKPVESVMSCNGLSDGAYYPDLIDECRSFYNCRNGVPKVLKCMDGMKFDLRTRKCIDDTMVQCGHGMAKRSMPCPGNELAFIGHKEVGCKSYTECRNGISFHRFCEGSKLFNEKIGDCDWPQNVKCESAAVQHTNEEIFFSDFHAKMCEDKVNGYVLGPNRNSKCASYFTCKNGKLIEKYCGDKLIFNWKIGVCDLAENVDGCNLNTLRPSSIDCTNKHNLRIQHPDDCSAYISCHVGGAYLHKCARGQLFNSSENTCLDDVDKKCLKSFTTSDDDFNLLAERPMKKDSKDRTNAYPNYANGCRSYFDCKSTFCKERFCRKSYAYNAEHLRCDPDDIVFCDTIDSTEGGANILVQNTPSLNRGRAAPTYIDCCVKQGTWYEDREDCTKFYVCVNGIATRQQCHKGQTFDVIRKICRQGAPCGGTTLPPVITGPTAECTEGDKKPYPFNPNMYYICLNGVWREATCPKCQNYNSTSKGCEPPATGAQCTDGDTKPYPFNPNMYYKCIDCIWREETCPAGQTYNSTMKQCESPVTGTECKNGETKPYPWNPTMYYKCINGIWREQQCPSGQVFNPVGNNCETPGSTTCTDGAVLPNYFDSKTYYQCNNNYWVLLNCPPNEIFNNVSRKCEGSSSTNSTTPPAGSTITPPAGSTITPPTPGSTASTAATNTPATIPTSTPTPECITGEIYPDSLNKTKFYVCYQGKLRPQICPQKMVFDATKKYCVIANSACGDIPNGGFTAASQSDKFYVCSNGQLVLQLCPPNQQFNPALGFCSTSGLPPLPPPPPPPPPPPSTNCGPIQQGQNVADLNDETKYFICIVGTLWPQSCPPNQVFSKETLYCVQAPTTTPPGSCGPYNEGEMISTCDDNYPNYYLMCVMGVFIIKECPTGFNFDSVNGNCSASSGGGTTGSCGNYADGDVWYNPAGDNMYFQCISGSTISRNCPSGLIFNSLSNFCMNPCGSYEATSSTYYVGSPNSTSAYYKCQGSPPALQTPAASCPAGSTFYQALGSLPSPNFCLTASSVAGLCPPTPSYAIVPISPNANCPTALSTISPYYVACNEGTATVQRCPRNSILYNGSCVFSTNCDTATPGTDAYTCICI